MTIDEVPLEWCYGDGVVLDLTHKKDGEFITKQDIVEALKKISYTVKPNDIVLIRTDSYKNFQSPKYYEGGPGMSREATEYLVDLGVRVMGSDTCSFDRPIPKMAEDHKKGIPRSLWPSHLLGREKVHIHMEQMAYLDQIPKPFGFKVAAFPIKIKKGSGALVRPVAIIFD
jgi:kynurenine formamidase